MRLTWLLVLGVACSKGGDADVHRIESFEVRIDDGKAHLTAALIDADAKRVTSKGAFVVAVRAEGKEVCRFGGAFVPGDFKEQKRMQVTVTHNGCAATAPRFDLELTVVPDGKRQLTSTRPSVESAALFTGAAAAKPAVASGDAPETFDPKTAPTGPAPCPPDTIRKVNPNGTAHYCMKNGKLHGPYVTLASKDPKSRRVAYVEYKDGAMHGKQYGWDADGDLTLEVENANGRPIGVWNSYKKGKLHGVRTYWTPTHIERAEVYRDGENVTVPDPVCPPGTKAELQRNLDLSYNVTIGGQTARVDGTKRNRRWCVKPDGKPHGPYVVYTSTMVAELTGTFVDGVEDGERTRWNDRAEPIGKETVKRGKVVERK